MTQLPNTTIITITVLTIGFLLRLGILATAPLWFDEAYSIWVTTTTWSDVLSGVSDPVHTPGYYVWLKAWSYVSDNLVWMRLWSFGWHILSVIAFLNLTRLIETESRKFAVRLAFALSGYFLVFDWQVRMYSMTLCLMILSAYTLWQKQSFWRETLLHIAGLYTGYAYVWYFASSFLYLSVRSVRNHQYRRHILPYVIALSGFIAMYPNVFRLAKFGISGVEWVYSTSSVRFLAGGFLGTFGQTVMTIVFGAVCMIGLSGILRRELTTISGYFCSTALIALTTATAFQLVGIPLVHLRSLQIVHLAVVFCLGYGFYTISETFRSPRFLIGAMTLCTLNTLLTTYGIRKHPREYLITYILWNELLTQADIREGNTILYSVQPISQSPVFVWSLEYTLKGKTTQPRITNAYRRIESSDMIPENCRYVSSQFVVLHVCSTD